MLGSLLVLGVSAAAREPQVILNSDNNYEVKIDGRTYSGNNTTIPNLGQGYHSVEVYQLSKGVFGIGKKRTQTSASGFELSNNDVYINVDQNGQLRINESGTGTNARKGNRGRTDNTWNKGKRNGTEVNDDTEDDDTYGDNDNGNGHKKAKKAKKNNGNGKKLGHYKHGRS